MTTWGLSEARLARMREVMAGYVERSELPGLVTLVRRRGEVHVEAIGTKAVGGSDPIRRDTLFRIASMTKPVAAAAAMTLVEECKLQLDEPVDRWLPELAARRVLKRLDGPLDDTVPANRPITVRDLLTLRMGFGFMLEPSDAYPIQKAMDDRGLSIGPHPPAAKGPDAWIRGLGELPLMDQPGETWRYDTGFDALGVLLARAADQPLETVLRERIFRPLGMDDTGFHVPAEKLGRLLPCYEANPESGALELFDNVEGGRWSRPPGFESAGGGLVSTVDDYLAFGQMMLDKGKHGTERILSRPSVELMTTDQLTSEQRASAGFFLDGRGWGLGVSIILRRDDVASVPGRFGWEGGLGTSWSSDPEEDIVAILMTQVIGFPSGVYRDFWTSIYQAIAD
jgi:CubicO group peptidase (beta-lactamase class C family)